MLNWAGLCLREADPALGKAGHFRLVALSVALAHTRTAGELQLVTITLQGASNTTEHRKQVQVLSVQVDH